MHHNYSGPFIIATAIMLITMYVNYATVCNIYVLYLYYDEGRDIRWNIAWPRGNSRGNSWGQRLRDFPRTQTIFDRISWLKSEYRHSQCPDWCVAAEHQASLGGSITPSLVITPAALTSTIMIIGSCNFPYLKFIRKYPSCFEHFK